ncbi:hypothetical protein SteCoe_12332 [Stentor coeruleus]|uniref:Sugar phosphate transporter domain-containing protein n=1 Tax=Stentor coeruleus TaxID=5963 RepID=A0A1R2CB17_9CILI|nr:hypothetical protein SteCoe_12332 [Stentor coeruleus]
MKKVQHEDISYFYDPIMKNRIKEEEITIKVETEDSEDKSKIDRILPKKTEISNFKYFLILAIAIGMKTWQPIAVGMSKKPDGTYSYNKTTMVILVELSKLAFCICAFTCQYFSTPSNDRIYLYNLPFRQSLHFIVPSILYGIANTMVYVGISFINPALFHVFGNIRIMTAGVLYRFIMKRPQTDLQWLALMMLTSGAILSSPNGKTEVKQGENGFYGLIASVIMCVTSSSSSIYTEINYKKTQQLSIFFQNIVLYVYGIIINCLWLLYSDSDHLMNNGLFSGFDASAVHVLISQAAMGISLSFIFKYLDNIVYVIAFTISMFLSAILSVFMFEFQFDIQFTCALFIVTAAIYLYYREKILDKIGITIKEAIW